MYPPSDELQDLLARLSSRAHELGTRCIYRGEPECFPRISSGLYRQLYEIDDLKFDIGLAQQRRIELARQYAPDLSDDDILTRLQHLGGKTNLIDFTRDLNIALFFGSYHSPERSGRVILMDEAHVLRDNRPVVSRERLWRDRLVPRGNPASMTDVQKSVWVEPWRGYITDESVTIVEIPSALKSEILWHLRVVYGIEASSVYNDLSGFIRDQDRFRDHEAEYFAGLRAYQAGHYEHALGFFAQYEQLVEEPESSLEYFRGILYWNIDRKEEALAAVARFRSRSPRDARAFPEEMESAYFEHRRSPDADRRRIERGVLLQRRSFPDSAFGRWVVMPVDRSDTLESSLTRLGPLSRCCLSLRRTPSWLSRISRQTQGEPGGSRCNGSPTTTRSPCTGQSARRWC